MAKPHSHPDRVLSVASVRCEGPAWSRMRRAFVLPFRLSEHGRDLVTCLIAVPSTILAGTALAFMLAPIFQGIPA